MAKGYLRQLDLTDFKSYSGHCTIGPFDPFTSIIGPNGSGKSNLMDAISFVLGVPSSKLRSSNLGELVHRRPAVPSGKTRSKQQRAATATVSAVYVKEGSSGEEVRFTRTVTTAGQSEYFLNNEPVSHAEYDKVLQSENILVKARNFLVFQGDVESIAGKTPKELTRLLEQISGSDSFKDEYDRLREEHERAVESSTFAFNKRRGLSAEIKAVQEQKEEVVRFEELLGQRQDLLSDLAMLQLRAVEDDAKRLSDHIDAQQSAVAEADQAHSQADQRYKEARKEHAKVLKEVLAVERKLKRAVEERDRGNPETVAAQEKQRLLEKRLQDGLQTHQRLTVEQERLAKEHQSLEHEIAALTAAQSAKEAELAGELAGEQQQVPAKLRTEYDALVAQVDAESAKEQLKLDTLERKIAPQQVQRKQVEAKRGELALRREQVAAELDILASRIAQLDRLLADSRQALLELDQQAKAKQSRRRSVAEEEAELEERLHCVCDDLLQIRSSEEETERERRCRASIDSLKRIFPGVHGTLLELCQPTSRRYEEPLMAVIGPLADAVIVDHHHVAVECVRYLREERLAPLTLIPLDSVEPAASVERVRQELADGSRLACDLLRAGGVSAGSTGGTMGTIAMTTAMTMTTGIARAIQFACGTAVVCESLAQCRAALSVPAVSKAVSLEGHVLHAHGQLTGGRHRHSAANAKRWEQEQVRELKAERDALMGRLHELGKEARRLDAEERQSVERVDVEERVRYLESELQAITRKQRGLDEERLHIDSELAAKQDDLDAIDTLCSKTVREMEQARARLAAIAAAVFADFTARTGIAHHRRDRAESEVSKAVAECRVEYSALLAKMRSHHCLVGQQLARCSAEMTEVRAAVGEAEAALATLHHSLSTLQHGLATKQQDVAALSTQLDHVRSKLAQIDTESLRQAVLEAAAKRQSVSKEIAMAELDIERALRERDSVLRRCAVEQVYLPLVRGSLADADFSMNNKRASRQQTAQRLADIQQQLDHMAPNLRAIDKLEGAEQRLKTAMESFERQRADAKRARDAFARIKQLRYDAFMPCFRHVCDAIDSIYKALTSDSGTAYLSLEDSEEPYLEGIRFHAMPPGKRFLDMEALSGGERTMAALALLFSLHSFLPSPFFILDEVDAALDNANVQRLAGYLRGLAATGACQLLVISLKPGLYEQADALVGVYRDPGQCSRPLTLRLTDYDHQSNDGGGGDDDAENAVPTDAPNAAIDPATTLQ